MAVKHELVARPEKAQPAVPIRSSSQVKKSEPSKAGPSVITKPAPVRDRPEPARSRLKPEPEWPGAPKTEYIKVQLKHVDATGYNSRLSIDEESDEFRDLVESVKKMGVVEPIIVTALDDMKKNKAGLRWDLVSGFRRYTALMRAKAFETFAVVHHYTHPSQRIFVNLLENQHRKSLRAYEEAMAFKKLRDQGFRLTTIADKLGISESKISNYVSCAENLIPELLELFRKNESEATMKQLITASRSSEEEQRKLLASLTGERPAPGTGPALVSKPKMLPIKKTQKFLEALESPQCEAIDVGDGELVFVDEENKKPIIRIVKFLMGEVDKSPLSLVE